MLHITQEIYVIYIFLQSREFNVMIFNTITCGSSLREVLMPNKHASSKLKNLQLFQVIGHQICTLSGP